MTREEQNQGMVLLIEDNHEIAEMVGTTSSDAGIRWTTQEMA